jgi:hypothetical protein
MESSGNYPAVSDNDLEEPVEKVNGHHKHDEGEETRKLRAQAMAALRQTRVKAGGNVRKTQFACAAVDEESLGDLEDSRILKTLRYDSRRFAKDVAPVAPVPADEGENEA